MHTQSWWKQVQVNDSSVPVSVPVSQWGHGKLVTLCSQWWECSLYKYYSFNRQSVCRENQFVWIYTSCYIVYWYCNIELQYIYCGTSGLQENRCIFRKAVYELKTFLKPHMKKSILSHSGCIQPKCHLVTLLQMFMIVFPAFRVRMCGGGLSSKNRATIYDGRIGVFLALKTSEVDIFRKHLLFTRWSHGESIQRDNPPPLTHSLAHDALNVWRPTFHRSRHWRRTAHTEWECGVKASRESADSWASPGAKGWAKLLTDDESSRA